jgi:hypothetical protein
MKNKINLPGFTAIKSLLPEKKNCIIYNFGISEVHVVYPEVSVVPQRATGPYGPIGLPGQDCSEACLHLCMLFPMPGGWKGCQEQCQATCTDYFGNIMSVLTRF